MMAVVLADDLLAVQLPQPREVVRAGRHQVRRVGAEGAVPNPPLVARQSRLEGERLRLLVRVGLDVVHLPDLCRVVCATGGQLLDVWGEQDSCDVFFVGVEMRDGEQLRPVVCLEEVPDKDITLELLVSRFCVPAGLGTYRIVRCAE